MIWFFRTFINMKSDEDFKTIAESGMNIFFELSDLDLVYDEGWMFMRS